MSSKIHYEPTNNAERFILRVHILRGHSPLRAFHYRIPVTVLLLCCCQGSAFSLQLLCTRYLNQWDPMHGL